MLEGRYIPPGLIDIRYSDRYCLVIIVAVMTTIDWKPLDVPGGASA